MWYVIYDKDIHGPFETRNQAILYRTKRLDATGLSGAVVADSWAQQHALSMVLVKPLASFVSLALFFSCIWVWAAVLS